MRKEKLLATIALTKIPGLGPIGIRNLLKTLPNAEDIFQNRLLLTDIIPEATERLIKALDYPQAFRQAEKELSFIEKGQIKCISLYEEAYPHRLLECDDAPALLYFKGEANLNSKHIINLIGTRNSTEYGKKICYQFIEEIREICPDILIVSGLAYGIDIHAHKAALQNQLPTVGVLAHGLDRIYPSAHRKTAIEMLHKGGLLTEYTSGTRPDRHNFIQRNRIVAGMCDATIIVESANKGGALITAQIADSYHRECFAFPGNITNEFSQGCNQLIRENKATLIQSAEDFVKAMGWNPRQNERKSSPVQRQLFVDLSDEEEKVVSLLKEKGEMQINMLVIQLDTPVHKLNGILFELEMKGIIRVLAGGMYQLN